MQSNPAAMVDPFAMLMDPQATLAAIEASTGLERLNRRVCRPLDRPLIPRRPGVDAQDWDREIDEAGELEVPGESD